MIGFSRNGGMSYTGGNPFSGAYMRPQSFFSGPSITGGPSFAATSGPRSSFQPAVQPQQQAPNPAIQQQYGGLRGNVGSVNIPSPPQQFNPSINPSQGQFAGQSPVGGFTPPVGQPNNPNQPPWVRPPPQNLRMWDPSIGSAFQGGPRPQPQGPNQNAQIGGAGGMMSTLPQRATNTGLYGLSNFLPGQIMGNPYQPQYTPFGQNPFAAQANTWDMLRHNPYTGMMNFISQRAPQIGRASPSQWGSTLDINRRYIASAGDYYEDPFTGDAYHLPFDNTGQRTNPYSKGDVRPEDLDPGNRFRPPQDEGDADGQIK